MDLAKKRRIKSAFSWVALVAVVALVVGISLFDKSGDDAAQAGQVVSAVAEKGSLSVDLRGGGKLVEQASTSIEVPAGVEIAEYFAGNGDVVNSGDPVARIDQVSLGRTILKVQESMLEIVQQISDEQSAEDKETILSPVAGRVKEIYAAEGDDIRSVMLRDGALLLLSLDGRIEVKLEVETELVPGDAVTLVFPEADNNKENSSEGSESGPLTATGRVESNLAGELVITATDEGYALSQEVEVYYEEKLIGTGTVEAHNAWRLMASEGTIGRVRIAPEQTIKQGDKLFELVSSAASSAKLLDDYEQYRVVLTELFRLKEQGIITAPESGRLEGIDEEKIAAASPVKEPGALSGTVMGAGEEDTDADNAGTENGDSGDGTTPAATPGETPTGVPAELPPEVQALYQEILSMILTGQYKGYIGILTGAADGQVGALIQPEGIELSQPLAILSMQPDITKMTEPAVFSTLVPIYQISGGQMSQADPAALTAGTPLVLFRDAAGADRMVLLIPDAASSLTPSQFPTDLSSLTPEQMQQLLAMAQAGQIPGLDIESLMGSYAGFDLSSLYSFDLAGMMGEPAVDDSYRIEPWDLGRIVPQSYMEFSVPVDEQDLILLSVGQETEVFIDAIGEEPFKGEIVKISRKGKNQGGSSKFDVTIRLPKEEDMLEGMSAFCNIRTSTREEILLIPTAALQEEGTRLYVYTGYDPQKQMFLNPVDVTIGGADAEHVEILSGLTEGTPVFYSVLGTPDF